MVRANRHVFAAAALCAIFVVAALISPWAEARSRHGQGSATPDASTEASPATGPGPGTGTGAAYMTLTNGGSESDRVLGGSVEVAEIIEIHDMKIDGGVMTMIPLVDGLEIPAGGTVVLKPQSLHVMLINLNRDLKPGDQFDLTLTFERAGDVVIPVTVGPDAPADAPPVTAGNITISGAWSRPAPMLSSGADHGAPIGSPVATPGT